MKEKIKDFFKKIGQKLKTFFQKIKSGLKKLFGNKKFVRIFVCSLLTFFSVTLILSLYPIKSGNGNGGSGNSNIPITHLNKYQLLMRDDSFSNLSYYKSVKIPSSYSPSSSYSLNVAEKKTSGNENYLYLFPGRLLYPGIPYSTPQLLYYAQDGLAENAWYKFTIADSGLPNELRSISSTYYFMLKTAVPAGGGFNIPRLGHSSVNSIPEVEKLFVKTYSPVGNYGVGGDLLETVSLYAYNPSQNSADCVDLGSFSYSTSYGNRNSLIRNVWGSLGYADSTVRQWLNSSAPSISAVTNKKSNWWCPQSEFDLPPEGISCAGYLNRFESEFVDSLTTTYVGNKKRDKVSLFSSTDVIGDESLNVFKDVRFCSHERWVLKDWQDGFYIKAVHANNGEAEDGRPIIKDYYIGTAISINNLGFMPYMILAGSRT